MGGCCQYPNGACQVISMQFLLFVAMALSWSALADCRFVEVAIVPGGLLDFPTIDGLGYFMFELDGDCAYDEVDEDQFRSYYYDLLGSDWKPGRAFGVLAAAFGIVLWIWSLCMICIGFTKCLRYIFAVCLLVMVIFQGLTFLPLNSGFCKDFDCEFSRGAGLSVGALISFFFCAILCLLMRDEPSDDLTPVYSASPTSAAVKNEIARPFVTREMTSSEVSPTEPPLGALLTGAVKLREAGLTGKEVRVAVIDSGVDKDHPGFMGQVKKQEWYRSGTPLSEDDHGTHVAGTIHLMAPEAEIYDYRVFGIDGRLGVSEAIAAAIYQAVNDECTVINMSLGGPFPNSAIRDAVKHARANGVILVCAAGNEGDNNPLTNEISYPASYEECISVAAVSKKDGLPVARFSNSNPQVDYAGIGVDVVSFKPGGGFQIMSGTSMASPHVAGFVSCLMTSGRIKSDHPSNTDETIRKILTGNYAIDINVVGPDNATGVGFLTYLEKPEFDELIPKLVTSPVQVQ